MARPSVVASMMSPMKGAAALMVVFGFSTGACGGPEAGGSAGAADCTAQIQSDGVVFTSYGYTSNTGSKYGIALEAVCEDVGADARGSVFTDESRQVTTYRFPGYPPSQVLGVRYSPDEDFAVFVADSVSPNDQDRIYRELSQPSHSGTRNNYRSSA
jgi:hypothetical protein